MNLEFGTGGRAVGLAAADRLMQAVSVVGNALMQGASELASALILACGVVPVAALLPTLEQVADVAESRQGQEQPQIPLRNDKQSATHPSQKNSSLRL